MNVEFLVLACLAVLQLSFSPSYGQPPPLIVFLTHPSADQEANVGDTVNLNCTASDGYIVHWLLDDVQISANNSAYSINGGNLTINSFQAGLAGLYRCVVSTDSGITRQVSHAGRVTSSGAALAPLDAVPSPSGDINVASVQQFTLSSTGNLPIVSPPQQTFTVRWWLNGRPLNESSNSHTIDSQSYNLRLLSVMYQDGGIYQAEVTVPGSSVTFRNFVVRPHTTIVQSFSWKSPTSATILPVSSEVMVSPRLPTERLKIMSGILNSTGGLQASDAGTYIITLMEYFGTAELRFRISVSGADDLPVNWKDPGIISAGVLPSNPAGYTSNPPLPPRLILNSITGDFISLGQLQQSDAQTYDITAPGVFEGSFSLSLRVSIGGSETATIHWTDTSSIHRLLPESSSNYMISPSLPNGLQLNSSGYLISTGQKLSSDARIYTVQTTSFGGIYQLTLSVSVAGTLVIRVPWMTPVTRKILPDDATMTTTYPQFMTNSSGFLVANEFLLEDAGSYNLNASNYVGTLQVDIVVDAPGYVLSPLQDTNVTNGSTVNLECSANGHPQPLSYIWKKNGVQIANISESRLSLTSVSPRDVGEYSCFPSSTLGNFNSTSALVNIKIDLTLPWLTRHNLQVFPPARSGYQCRAIQSTLSPVPFEINREGVFITTRIEAEIMEQYECTSDDINGTLTIGLRIVTHPPLQPVIIDSTVTRDNKLNITWSNNATDTRPVDWYILEITTQPQGELSDSRARQTSRDMTMTVNTTNIYHVTEDDYSRSIQYQFRIKAVNTAGESEFSDPFSHIHEPVVGGISGKLPSWGIALIVVLSVLICCACCLMFGCCILCCCYRRRQKKVYRAEEREKKYGANMKWFREVEDGSEDEASISVESESGIVADEKDEVDGKEKNGGPDKTLGASSDSVLTTEV